MPREDLRKIGARDRHAADKIAELRHRHPDALILVLFGESHLAPQHLPALLQQRLPRNPCSPSCKTSTLSTGALPEKLTITSRPSKSAKTPAKTFFASSTQRPLEKYENYRLCLDRWGRSE